MQSKKRSDSYYKFIHVNQDGTKVVVRLDGSDQSLDELADNFLYFLRGCSFILDNKQVVFEDIEDFSNESEEE
jgi:hypothetical protein